jgi:ABC-type sugar transport system ATPase subunit
LFRRTALQLDAALRGQMRVELRKLHHDMPSTDDLRNARSGRGDDLAERIVVLEAASRGRSARPPSCTTRLPTSSSRISSQPADEFSARILRENRASGAGFALSLPDAYASLDGEAREVFRRGAAR